MSKQSDLVKKVLKMLSLPFKQEVGLDKITHSKFHAGIALDFYLPNYAVGIEVHGIQHYQISSFGADDVTARMNYNKQLFRDDKLRTICKQYNVKLLEIPYDMSYIDIITIINEVTE